MENALDLLETADHLQIEELKINCIKFISLNVVSYLETSTIDRLITMPVYLLREIENFIKLDDEDKFVSFDM